MSRKIYIDRLKGLAMLLVVIGHIYSKCLYPGSDVQCTIASVLQTFRMPLFMFLSGVVIAAAPSLKKCLQKTILFLMPAIVVGFVFCIYTGWTFVEFINSGTKHGYWYLFVLTLFYWNLIAYRWIPEKWGSVMFLLLGCIEYVILSNLGSIIPKNVYDILCYQRIVAYFPFFMLGHYINKYKLFSYFEGSQYVHGLSLLLIIVIACYSHFLLPSYYIITPLAIIAFLMSAFPFREGETSFVEKKLEEIGKYTLDIYIYHYFFIVLIKLKPIGEWFSLTNNPFIEFVFVLLLSLLVLGSSILVGKIIKSNKYIENIVYGKYILNIIK